jgi:cobalamin-dependent methionine synthase I
VTWLIQINFHKTPLIVDAHSCSLAGEEAKKVFDDAQCMLKKIVAEKSLKANGVIAFYKASSVGDDIHVYDEAGNHIETLFGLRQQVGSILNCVVV